MTDITELAQCMKAAAEKATQGEWRRASTQINGITATPFMLGRKEVMIAGASEKRDAEFIAMANPANVLALVEALEKAKQERENWRTSFDNERFRADKLKAHIDEMTEERTASINELSRIIQKEVKAKREAEKRIAELEREYENLRPVGVMSEKAYHRLENRESRFIALWPRPEIYLPRKRPEDGVIVYARTTFAAAAKEAD